MTQHARLLGAYAEVCDTIRHYSNASLAVRLTSVAQGFALLAAWVFALSESLGWPVLVFPLIGVGFTILLYRFHMGYFKAAEFFYTMAAEIENELFEVGPRPFEGYIAKHDELFGNWSGNALTLNAPFTLVGLTFVIAGIVSALLQFGSCG